MNGWSDVEKASMLAGVLRELALSVLLSLKKDARLHYEKLTAALKLRFGDAFKAELLYGQLHRRVQQPKDDLMVFAYEIQNLTR